MPSNSAACAWCEGMPQNSEPGVLALAADGQGELVVGYDHLSLLLILVQVDFTYARRAQGLRYKACRLRVPLDDIDLLVPELGDHSPYPASPATALISTRPS